MGSPSVRPAAVIEGIIRSDRNTKRLLRALAGGEIALIRHADLDVQAATGLLEARAKAVVNAAPTLSGAFPHDGPLCLLRAGIPLFEIDGAGFERIGDGQTVRIADGLLVGDGIEIACVRFGYEDWLAGRRSAERRYRQTVLEFAANTLRYAGQELRLLLEPLQVPTLRKPIEERPVLIVSRGNGYKEDLAALREFILEAKPALIGVDGGADALAAEGFRPDLIVGDMDSVSDETMRCGAQLVAHAYADGRSPGMERIRALGLYADIVAAPGTSEDVALRIAYEQDAAQIVIVGSHSGPIDFLEKGRAGMASTLLVRMLVGHKLIDARGASLWTQPAKPRLQMIPGMAEGGGGWTYQYR